MNHKKIIFDIHANDYDAWFKDNENLLKSEANLVAAALLDDCAGVAQPLCDAGFPGRTFSVGCGSGLFEYILRTSYNIDVHEGLEPSDGMAAIASKRGMEVSITTAEEMDWPVDMYDTILFNGTPSYITDLKGVVKKAYGALKMGGRVILVDVPKEGNYGALYNLAMTLGTWEHPLVSDVHPSQPYPIEFVKVANWRTTAEKIACIEEAGFTNLTFKQTLTKHPLYSNTVEEEPISGFDAGDYVAIIAVKK